MKHRPLVFLDIETTGASARSSRITEIGALRVEEGVIVGKFSELVNPEEHIPAFISRMTGITDEMVWDSPTFQGIAHELEYFMDGAVFIAHHVNFDYSFIREEYAKLKNNFSMDRACTVRLDRRLYPDQRSHALDRIIERMGLEVANRHRAFDDAEVLWKFFEFELRQRGLDMFVHLEKSMTRARTVGT